jgi:hypothetical protein
MMIDVNKYPGGIIRFDPVAAVSSCAVYSVVQVRYQRSDMTGKMHYCVEGLPKDSTLEHILLDFGEGWDNNPTCPKKEHDQMKDVLDDPDLRLLANWNFYVIWCEKPEPAGARREAGYRLAVGRPGEMIEPESVRPLSSFDCTLPHDQAFVWQFLSSETGNLLRYKLSLRKMNTEASYKASLNISSKDRDPAESLIYQIL